MKEWSRLTGMDKTQCIDNETGRNLKEDTKDRVRRLAGSKREGMTL
jgi:hypothetical protein